MLSYNTLIVLLGTTLLGATAGLVGTFAVLRRRSLTGDALAHAALPGLCLGFLLWRERSLPVLLAGAFCSGLLGVGIISGLRRFTRIKEDAAIGIVLSVFFGAGICLSRIIQNRFPGGAKAGLDTYILGTTGGILASDVWLIAGLSLICFSVLFALFKEFGLVVFDPAFARVQGWPALLLDLILMALIAVVVVVGLPAVGVVLMASLLILPGVTARFWTDRLNRLLWLSLGIGGLIGACGTLLSATFDKLPAGPIIVLTGTSLFLFSMAFAPRRGTVSRWLAVRRFQKTLELESLLRHLFHAEQGTRPTSSIGPRGVQAALHRRFIEPDAHLPWRLTALGRETSRRLVLEDLLRHEIALASPQLAPDLFAERNLDAWSAKFPAQYQTALHRLDSLGGIT